MSSDSTSTPPPSSLVGGKYELRGLIGRGGMGSVYEGRHHSLGTPVAIKFIDVEHANSADAKTRFDTEARAAATIQSKHAIQIYDHGVTDDGRPFIVMELLVGEALDKRITRLGVISLEETARIIRQVARALARAHERGIIHRDLKPENIFLVRGPDDDEDIAKVLDFGIAKIKSTPGAVGISSSTKTGTLLGTPFFMSPEQARGLRTVDQRSDLWSLGVIVFKCVTGILPFDGESLGDLLVKICTAPIPLPSHVRGDLPPHLDGWTVRALDREPDHRFQTATELAESLAAVAGLPTVRGGPSSANLPDPNSYSPSSPYSPRPVSSGEAHARTAREPVPFSGPEYAQAIPPATSAPLTASTPQPVRRSSKLGYLAGAVIGLAAGFTGVFYLVAGLRASSVPGIASPSAPPPESASAASPPPASAAWTAAPPADTSASPPVPPLEPPPAAAAHPAKPPATKSTQKPPKTTTTTPPVATALPPAGAVLPAAPPTPPKQAPANAGEPGY
jgi:eukaryotic-like serine/threonine-protein kinase